MKNEATQLRSTLVGLFFLIALVQMPVVGYAQETWPAPIEDNQIFWFLLFDQLEFRGHEGPDPLRWDAEGWLGTDYNRLWLKTEGQHISTERNGELEVQFLYSRLISSFWEFQAGLRYDRTYGPGPDRSRFFAVIGIQGLAPYWFELEPALFISGDGDVSARLTANYDLLFTQRLILQPRFEFNVAIQDVEDFGVGSGLNDLSLGFRLRYEIKREFAPYFGISWLRKFGEAADISRREGETADDFNVVGGLRLWF
jgi:copper resistance protein B